MKVLFDFFNFKKHPSHLWLFFSLGTYIVMLIYVFIDDGLGYKLGLSRMDKNTFILGNGPINLVGVCFFIYIFINNHRDFFQSFPLIKAGFYLFLSITAGNAIWMLKTTTDTWRCNGFLCDWGMIPPLFSILITTALLFLYTIIIFRLIKKKPKNNIRDLCIKDKTN